MNRYAACQHAGARILGDLIGVAADPVANLALLSRPENIRLVVKGRDVVKPLEHAAG